MNPPTKDEISCCFASKEDGGHGFCVGFQKIKAVTETDAYPFPNINEFLESVSGATIFSTFNLHSGYWQEPMNPESKAKTALLTVDYITSMLFLLDLKMHPPLSKD